MKKIMKKLGKITITFDKYTAFSIAIMFNVWSKYEMDFSIQLGKYELVIEYKK